MTLGQILKPCLEKSNSLYGIKQTPPEINVSEQMLYNYIKDSIFQAADNPITFMDLKRHISRKPTKKSRV